MQQIYEAKVIALTRGGLADGKKTVVTTNCKKSAEAIVPSGKKKTWKGLNNHKF